MSNFGNYAFGKSTNNKSNDYQDVTEILGQFATELDELITRYEPTMRREFASLNKNNEKWMEEHNGEGCKAFENKMWALSAPSETVKIIKDLYVNRVRKDN
jgi:hypothetical protein